MADDREQLREISENEAWVSQNMPAESSASLEHLKLRVRVELGEQWLSAQLPPAIEPVSQGLRDRVRADVFESTSIGPIQVPSRRRQRKRVVAAVGFATMIFLGILVARNARVINSLQAEEFDEFVFEEEVEDVDWELSLLDDELVELGEGLAFGGEPEWDDEFELDFESDSDF